MEKDKVMGNVGAERAGEHTWAWKWAGGRNWKWIDVDTDAD